MEIVNMREPEQKLRIINSNFSKSEIENCYAEAVRFSNVSLPNMSFTCADVRGSLFHNVTLEGSRIHDANLSDLEIDGAQLGGAYIHNIGMPPEGHPAYDPNNMKQRPLKFENCDLMGSTINDCNLMNIKITNCNIEGLSIDGIDISKLIKKYKDEGMES